VEDGKITPKVHCHRAIVLPTRISHIQAAHQVAFRIAGYATPPTFCNMVITFSRRTGQKLFSASMRSALL
jgi:hypothetical protein